MTKEKLAYYKGLLLERKEQIEKNLEDTMSSSAGLNSNDPKDEGDSAFVSADSFTGSAIAKQQSAELDEIMVALDKIEKDEYGICEMCEDDIPDSRLEVKPFAKYCIDCREIVESSPKN